MLGSHCGSLTPRWAAITIYWVPGSVRLRPRPRSYCSAGEPSVNTLDTFGPVAFNHNLYGNYFGRIFSHQRRLTFNSFGDAVPFLSLRLLFLVTFLFYFSAAGSVPPFYKHFREIKMAVQAAEDGDSALEESGKK